MDHTLKIKVNISNRTYPLTIKREEEEAIRLAVKHINEAVKRFEERYAVQDKQDVLAMCALQIATQNVRQKQKYEEHSGQVESLLTELGQAMKSDLA